MNLTLTGFLIPGLGTYHATLTNAFILNSCLDSFQIRDGNNQEKCRKIISGIIREKPFGGFQFGGFQLLRQAQRFAPEASFNLQATPRRKGLGFQTTSSQKDLGPLSTPDEFLGSLRDRNYRVRAVAVRAIGQWTPPLDPKDRLAMALAVEKSLMDQSFTVKLAAVKALGNITVHLNLDARLLRAVALVEMFKHPNEMIRAAAARALGNIIPHLEAKDRLKMVVEIEERLADRNKGVRLASVKALRNILPHLALQDRLSIVVAMELRLEDKEVQVRNVASKVLSETESYLE